jgi:hypothetical protein
MLLEVCILDNARSDPEQTIMTGDKTLLNPTGARSTRNAGLKTLVYAVVPMMSLSASQMEPLLARRKMHDVTLPYSVLSSALSKTQAGGVKFLKAP